MQHEYRHKTKIKHADLPDLNGGSASTIIYCPSCSEKVHAADLNINDMVGKCDRCDSVFSIKKDIANLQQSADVLYTEDLGRPEGVELNYFNDELELSVTQGPPILDIILLSFLPLGLLIGTLLYFKEGNPVGLVVLFGSLALLARSTYNLIVHKRNKTFVSVDRDRIEVVNRPKNFKTDAYYESKDIDQLYIKPDPTIGGYAVYIILNDPKGQKHKRLISGMKSLIKAKYVEQEVERHLGITDKKVIGEIQ